MPPVPSRVGENISDIPTESSTPDRLRPYAHHGVELTPRGSHAVGTCPFCMKDGKFSVDCDTGLWRCFVCGGGTESGGGNPLTFLRLLWERSDATTNGQGKAIAEDRGLLDPATVTAWGVCVSIIDRSWLVPGYDTTGKLTQVYRRARVLDKGQWVWRLLPTPGVWPDGKVHAIHMPSLTFDPAKPRLDVCEGPWDGMAFWEIARQTKRNSDGAFALTGSESSSIIADSNVVAVPGCNVFPDHWLPMFKSKDVTIWFDSDHPRVVAGKTYRAGFDGVYRVAKKLSGIASNVRWLRWGKEGYDLDKPSGYDVRDELKSHTNRRDGIAKLYAKVEPAPADWFNPTVKINGHSHNGKPDIEVQRCDKWKDLENRWTDALEWRPVLSDVLTVLLSVCASTQQGGNQLFCQLIAEAGSAKTTLCEGLLVSSHCHHLEHLTGFHSGWKLPGGDSDKDCSLIARINGKTLVTCEADVMISNPRFAEIMAQQRRIFDGKSGASYKNTDQDILYEGLRTPWIMAGTKKLLSSDQSQLGDRFLRIMVDPPSEDLKRRILSSAFDSEMSAIMETSNGTSASITEPKLRKAQAMTGGYVDYLRANVENLIHDVVIHNDVKDRIIDLAELSADLRARPDLSHKRPVDQHDSKELPTRLTRQFARLAKFACIVLNKREVDGDVMRIVRKVALDTAYGHTLSFVTYLTSYNPKKHGCTYQQTGGLGVGILSLWTGLSEERLETYLNFLRKIGVAVLKKAPQSQGYWMLTERVYNLYLKV